jgi:PiT family inorganic phosphate transporter
MHIPVSTTHTITGAIIGVGSTTRIRGIKWGLASRIVWGWVFTIPLSAGMASATFLLVRRFWL